MDTAALFRKKLLFVTGKGGIGKTMVAAALGQAAAAAGKRVLLMESSSLDQLAPLFGHGPVGHHETIVGPNLACINLSPPETFEEYVVKYLGQKKLFDRVFTNKVVRSFINTVPGFAEIMMLGRLFYTCELAPGPRHDLVIFDGYASGHFLSLMTTPDAVLQSNLGGPLTTETARVRTFLATPEKVGIVYVGVPEDLVVSECLDFLPKLRQKSPAAIAGVLMNKMPRAEHLADSPDNAAKHYAWQKLQRAERAMATLDTGLVALEGQLGVEWPLATLPDLGFIDEPLAPEFGPALLRELKRVVTS